MASSTALPRIGVVGYGAIGRHHARNLAALKDCDFIGVVDPDPHARNEARSAGYPTFDKIEALLPSAVDALVLSVPTALHRDYALKCISAKCALLVEKPIAMTVAQGREIVDAAHRSGVPLMVGYVERYNPAIVALRNFMNRGGLGKVLGISARRVGTMPARIRDANVLVDIGVHDIDLAAFLLDSDLVLRSAQGGRAVLDDRLDYAFLALEGLGIPVHIESNWVTPVKIREVFVTGVNGLCHVDYVTQTVRFAQGRDFPQVETFEGIVEQYKLGEFATLKIDKEEPLRKELRTFLAGIRSGDLPDPALSLVSLRVAEEATNLIDKHHGAAHE
jgi:hypothetical protein